MICMMKNRIGFVSNREKNREFESKNELLRYIISLEKEFISLMERKQVVIYEKIEVFVQEKVKKVKGITEYYGIFCIRGVYSQINHEEIHVCFSGEVKDDTFPYGKYFASLFQLCYRGYLATKEEIVQYSKYANYVTENTKKIILHAKQTEEIKEEQIKKLEKKSFRIVYNPETNPQTYIYLYEESFDEGLKKRLKARATTHDIQVEVYENELLAYHEIMKAKKKEKIVGKKIS